MSVLTVAQQVADRLGIQNITGIASTTDNTARQIKALMQQVGEEVRSAYRWAELQKEFTITLEDGVNSYPLPTDFLAIIDQTAWDQENYWPLVGPMTPQSWQARRSGISETVLNREFIVKGISNANITGNVATIAAVNHTRQFHLWDTPSAGDVGNTYVFNYYSRNWIRPKLWNYAVTANPGEYRSWLNNIYYTSAGGTISGIPPTHTSGQASDGGVTWFYTDGPYESIVANEDELNLPEDVIKQGVVARFYEAKGLPQAASANQRFETLMRERVSSLSGAPVLSLDSGGIHTALIPETGYGG